MHQSPFKRTKQANLPNVFYNINPAHATQNAIYLLHTKTRTTHRRNLLHF